MSTANLEKKLEALRRQQEKLKEHNAFLKARARGKVYSETQVANSLVKAVKGHNGYICKLHPLTEKGIPDYMCIVGQRVFFVETKTTGRKCDPIQVEYHKRLKSYGCDTYVLDTKIENFNDLYNVAYKTYDPNYNKHLFEK